MIDPDTLKGVLRKQLTFTTHRKFTNKKTILEVLEMNIDWKRNGIPHESLIRFMRLNLRNEIAGMLLKNDRSKITINTDEIPLMETLWYQPENVLPSERDA